MENGANKYIKQKSIRASLPRLFWPHSEGETTLPVHLLLLAQSNKVEQQVGIHEDYGGKLF